MSKALGAVAVVAAVAIAGGIWVAATWSPSPSTEPVSAADASTQIDLLVDGSRQVVSAGSAQEFCDDHAASAGMCQESASALKALDWATPVGDPVVAMRAASGGTVIADVRGTLSTGRQFKGALELVRDASGNVKAVDPVFWVDKVLVIPHGTSATEAPQREP